MTFRDGNTVGEATVFPDWLSDDSQSDENMDSLQHKDVLAMFTSRQPQRPWSHMIFENLCDMMQPPAEEQQGASDVHVREPDSGASSEHLLESVLGRRRRRPGGPLVAGCCTAHLESRFDSSVYGRGLEILEKLSQKVPDQVMEPPET